MNEQHEQKDSRGGFLMIENETMPARSGRERNRLVESAVETSRL